MEDFSPQYLDEARQRLEAVLRALPRGKAQGWLGTFSFALAYSGGLDSRFLAFAAKSSGLAPLLLHACGPHLAPGESAEAAAWAEKQGLTLLLLPCDPLPQVGMNDKERCYRCKKSLFQKMLELDLTLADGSNASDADGYRPGRKALRELGVHSPLELAGLHKPALRALAARMGLDNPAQPSRPCMLTRLNYGLRPEPALLAALGKAEAGLEQVLTERLQHRPALRLRLVSEQNLELHMLEPEPDGDNALELLALAQETVHRCCGLSLAALRWNQGSGFFDTPDA